MTCPPPYELLPCGKPPVQSNKSWNNFPPNFAHGIAACLPQGKLVQRECIVLTLKYLTHLVEPNVGHAGKTDLMCGTILFLYDLPPRKIHSCRPKHQPYWNGVLFLLNILKGLPVPGETPTKPVLIVSTMCNAYNVPPPDQIEPLTCAMNLLFELVKDLTAICAEIASTINNADTVLVSHKKKLSVIRQLRQKVEILQQQQSNLICLHGFLKDVPLH